MRGCRPFPGDGAVARLEQRGPASGLVSLSVPHDRPRGGYHHRRLRTPLTFDACRVAAFAKEDATIVAPA